MSGALIDFLCHESQNLSIDRLFGCIRKGWRNPLAENGENGQPFLATLVAKFAKVGDLLGPKHFLQLGSADRSLLWLLFVAVVKVTHSLPLLVGIILGRSPQSLIRYCHRRRSLSR